MQGHKQFVDKVVLRFQLSERVPKQNLYRRLAELLDWDFLYAQTQGLYSHTGQPSLDPVVFCKLMLVSRLENLVSDRRLVEHCGLRLDRLYFLGDEVDEDLPGHSTISRTRQLFPAASFEHLFDQVFAQCVAAGLVTGHTQAVGSAPLKANASLESLCEKQSAEVLPPAARGRRARASRLRYCARGPAFQPGSPAHELRRVATTHARYLRHDSGPLGRDQAPARLLSNKTHYSPADPDARISVKPGKVRALNYLCSLAVDKGHGLISHIQADFADRRDSVLLESIVAPLHHRLLAHDLPVQQVVADTNYSNGVNYALLEARGITPWMPVFGKYKPETAGFTYDAQADCFTCSAARRCLSRLLIRIRTVDWEKYTGRLAGTAACARSSRPARRRSRSGNLFARPPRLTTAGR